MLVFEHIGKIVITHLSGITYQPLEVQVFSSLDPRSSLDPVTSILYQTVFAAVHPIIGNVFAETYKHTANYLEKKKWKDILNMPMNQLQVEILIFVMYYHPPIAQRLFYKRTTPISNSV